MNLVSSVKSVRGVGGAFSGVARLARRLIASAGIALAIAGGVAMPATEARAQWGMMGGGMGMDTSVTRQGFDAYVRLLKLDDDQKELARQLLDGNRKANKDLAKDMMGKFTALGEKAREEAGGDWGKIGQLMKTEATKLAKDYQEKSKGLEKQFFDDLKALCTEEQNAHFVAVERHRRRELQMRFGLATGMSTDLVEAVRLAKIDADSKPEMKETLGAYEADMDRLLVNWEKGQQEWQDKNMDAMFDGSMWGDEKKRDEMFKPVVDAAKQIRDLNRSTGKRILAMLPEDQRASLDLEIKRKEFPRVYRESHAEKTINEALKFSDLDASQKETLASLKQSYARDAASVNERWAKALEEREDKAGGRLNLLFSGMMWMPQEGDDPVAKEKKARKELDDKALERVQATLKEDQKARLPQKAPSKGMGMGMDAFEDFGWDMSGMMGQGGDDEE